MSEVETGSAIEQDKKRHKTKDNKPGIFKCNYIKLKNNKRCGLQVRKGQLYCFAHINQSDNTSTKKKKIVPDSKVSDIEANVTRVSRKGEVIKRVKCTVDPTHTVWEDKLTKHIKICNAVKIKQEIEEKKEKYPWFNVDYNVKDIEKHECADEDNEENKKLDYDLWKKLISKWDAKHDNVFTEELPLNNVQFKEGLEERFAEVSNQKHIIQQSSLIGQLVDNDVVNKTSNSNVIIEFGCGRAEFTRYFNKAMNKYFENPLESKSQYLLVDRECPRLKFDKKIISDSEEDGVKDLKVERLKVDIKDLKLIESLKDFKQNTDGELKFIGISKHLCGVATDLTLRCLINTIKDSKLEDNEQFKFNFGGCLVAMCCRHCCRHDWLLNESKQFLKDKFDIDESNFVYFRKMFAWATNGINPGMSKSDKCDHFSGLTFDERETIGLKMRRILDESRKYAMESKGFNVKIVRYVERDVSLENNCIIIK